MSPADGYRFLYSNPKFLAEAFGITEIAQIDAMVMKVYKKEFWPERLKEIKHD